MAIRGRWTGPGARAEALAALWETFSGLLFVSTIVPAALETIWPAVIFSLSLGLSAAARPLLLRLGARGAALAGAARVLAWLVAFAPLLPTTGPRVLVAAFAFGLMAAGIRVSVYRRLFAPDDEAALPGAEADAGVRLAEGLRPRVAESSMVAGIVGGHVMLLFSVAFLRTQSRVIFEGWRDVVPVLALVGTLGFTFSIRPLTRMAVSALRAGPGGDRALLLAGLSQALALPDTLATTNFVIWLACTATGVFYFRTGPASWAPGDAVMQVGFAALFSWGVSFYQRAWHRDTTAPAVAVLRRWTGARAKAEGISLRHRMLRDFGLPLLFMASLSLLSAIGLYRALVPDLPFTEDFNAITALFTSFSLLILAVGGVVARAARELSRPMTQLAEAADLVARGGLDVAVPSVAGPNEVVGLGESVERMREALARTIGELEEERRGLEEKVQARTAELRNALEELKRAQAALVQNERMASIGELVAAVAHEIYNPLNAIAGSVGPLQGIVTELREMAGAYRAVEGALPDKERQAVEAMRKDLDIEATLDDLTGISSVVQRATARSVRIVTNLKNFSRVSGEAMPTDLHAGLEETLMLLGPRFRQSGIRVERQLGELPLVVCRPGEMNQVFMNLLTNAIHALESGEGDSKASATSASAPGREEGVIVVQTWVEGPDALMAFADNGPGVPEEIARRVFDPFFTTKPRGQGTGLGLSISTDIVRRHGGVLSLERSAAGGARFVCRLPVLGVPSERPRDSRPRSSGRIVGEGPSP